MAPLQENPIPPESDDWWKRFVRARQKGQFSKYALILVAIGIGLVVLIVSTSPTAPAPIVPQTVSNISPVGQLGIFLGLALIFLAAALLPQTKSASNLADQIVKENYESAQRQAKDNPEAAKPTWDIANATLQAYYNRNLQDIRSIYTLSRIVLMAGFILILAGGGAILINPTNTGPAVLGAVSGIITEFIGATFIVVYRSANNQAIKYMRSLEKVNMVGVAVKILDDLADPDHGVVPQEIIDAKIALAKALISQSQPDKD